MRLTKTDKKLVERLRDRKQRTLEQVQQVLSDVVRDNPQMFKPGVEARVKEMASIVRKMSENPGCTLENLARRVRDIAGARITCCTTDEIKPAVELIRKHTNVKKCTVLREWTEADQYGYRAQHLAVKVRIRYQNKSFYDDCEVQIRSMAMDLWAVLSRLDFYKSAREIPLSVQKDMVTLSKLMAVVDDHALSIRQRLRDEANKASAERGQRRGVPTADMLTIENVQGLPRSLTGGPVPVDVAYSIITFALKNNILSIKEYKRLAQLPRVAQAITRHFVSKGLQPSQHDRLLIPVLLHSTSASSSRRFLTMLARNRGQRTTAQEVQIGKTAVPGRMTTPTMGHAR